MYHCCCALAGGVGGGVCWRGKARVHVRPEGQSKCAGSAGGVVVVRSVPRVTRDSRAARFASCRAHRRQGRRGRAGGAGRAALGPRWEGPYQCPMGGKRAVLMPPSSREGGKRACSNSSGREGAVPCGTGRGTQLVARQRYGEARQPWSEAAPAPLSAASTCPQHPRGIASGRTLRAEPGRGGPRRRRIVPIAGCGFEEGRANQRRAGRTKGGAGGEGAACARGAVWRRAGSWVSPRGRTGPNRAGPDRAQLQPRHGPRRRRRAGPGLPPRPLPLLLAPSPARCVGGAGPARKERRRAQCPG